VAGSEGAAGDVVVGVLLSVVVDCAVVVSVEEGTAVVSAGAAVVSAGAAVVSAGAPVVTPALGDPSVALGAVVCAMLKPAAVTRATTPAMLRVLGRFFIGLTPFPVRDAGAVAATGRHIPVPLTGNPRADGCDPTSPRSR
jgi:hypothetical protein